MGTGPDHDLFLSYHSPDRPTVQELRTLLQARGVKSFLDRDNLTKGMPWPRELEEALKRVRAVAVFIGEELGTWQKRELWFALDRQAREEKQGNAFPVIPILLKGADPTPGFLFLNTWIDLREQAMAEALDALVQTLRGNSLQIVREVSSICPYRALDAFKEEHAAFFFGREEFVLRLFEKTAAHATSPGHLVAVVGPSGTGKSSLVQAGLLPRLRKQRPPDHTWDAVIFTPGDRPFHRLAESLMPLLEPAMNRTEQNIAIKTLGDALLNGKAELEISINQILRNSHGTDRLLLVVDQFEELFRLTPEGSRKPFLDMLLTALNRAPVTVLLTLRSDFYGHAIAISRDLSDRLEHNKVNLGPMRREELQRTIVEPAQLVGLKFESDLSERILDDVGSEPGNLPLLEFALSQLWQEKRNGFLTLEGYKQIGKVSGAIAEVAERVFKTFSSEEKRIVRQVFTRLVRVAQPDEGGEDTRRRAVITEVPPEAQSVIKKLADARLLVTGQEIKIEADPAQDESDAKQ